MYSQFSLYCYFVKMFVFSQLLYTCTLADSDYLMQLISIILIRSHQLRIPTLGLDSMNGFRPRYFLHKDSWIPNHLNFQSLFRCVSLSKVILCFRPYSPIGNSLPLLQVTEEPITCSFRLSRFAFPESHGGGNLFHCLIPGMYLMSYKFSKLVEFLFSSHHGL